MQLFDIFDQEKVIRLNVYSVQESEPDQRSRNYKINGFEQEVIGRASQQRRQIHERQDSTVFKQQSGPNSSRMAKNTVKRGGATGPSASGTASTSIAGSNDPSKLVELIDTSDDDQWAIESDDEFELDSEKDDSSDEGDIEAEEREGDSGYEGKMFQNMILMMKKRNKRLWKWMSFQIMIRMSFMHHFQEEEGNVEGKVELAKWMEVENVDQFRSVLKNYSIQEGFEMYKIRNERTRVTAICATDGCPWRIHASPLADGLTFGVKSYTPKHTCKRWSTNNMATSRWIASKLAPQLKADASMSIKSMEVVMNAQYQLVPSKQQLYRARMIAKEAIEGKHSNSFAQLPSYGELVRQYNPSTMFNLQFKRLFVCFKACTNGFLLGCRAFIGLDGCHLKGMYDGVFLSAIALDGNNGLFPIALGVVEAECKDSWLWFLDSLYIALHSTADHIPHLTFMSDKQKGLMDAIAIKFPGYSVRHCSRHLYQDFKTAFPGTLLRNIFWTASKAYRFDQFQKAMNDMKDLHPEAHEWLVKNPPSTWSRHAFDFGVKSDHVTNNMTESFNQWIASLRDKPIVILIDQMRVQMMTKFQQRYASGCNYQGKITPNINKLDSISNAGRSCTGYGAGLYEFEVNDGVSTVVVNLIDRTCSCRVWE
ncbi:uncharacterized protein LOC122651119 [Telopea speciosissima]|uniref:uncharacterized protein LOC122651119 n=1 Tax=Telopea speciosissima TaxID=54955 RepID=UPI001CC5DE32|nr:uncharacterized protein LOC122651119 [Telopea speciosissima]